MSERILDGLTAAGESALLKEDACVKLYLDGAAQDAVRMACRSSGMGMYFWVWVGLSKVGKDTWLFWASDRGIVVASRAWVKRYDAHGDWVRTWRLNTKS